MYPHYTHTHTTHIHYTHYTHTLHIHTTHIHTLHIHIHTYTHTTNTPTLHTCTRTYTHIIEWIYSICSSCSRWTFRFCQNDDRRSTISWPEHQDKSKYTHSYFHFLIKPPLPFIISLRAHGHLWCWRPKMDTLRQLIFWWRVEQK